MKKYLALIVGITLLGFGTFVGCDSPVAKETPAAGTKPAAKASEHATIEITDENFESLVLNSEQPVLLDFWATWCGPCIQLAPTVEQLAEQYDGKLVVGKVDVDENQDLAVKYDISTIPALLYFKDGEMVKISQARTLEEMKADADEVIED